jgi:hypothetical protein
MQIVKNNKPKLEPPEMLCDGGLHEKLNKYELTKFLNEHSTTLFIGAPRSGKTSLLISLIKKPLSRVWHNIFLFQPVESGASIKNSPFDKLPDEKKLHELNSETLGSVMEYIKAEDKKHNNLIIFDDMTAYLKNKDTLNMFKELVFNRRHMRTTIFFLVQTWHSVPKELRRLFSNIFLFKSSHDANKLLFDEVLPIIDEEKRNAIIKLVYDKPYKFLFINTGSNRLFDCWDEILWDGMNSEPNIE